MNDYVVYHNPDVMGYDAIDVENLGIYTSKVPGNVVGSRVWLVTGEGKPRSYRLRATFVVSAVDESDKPQFQTRISGKAGQFLHPMPLLNEEPWFAAFKKIQGNFAFGFQPVGDAASVAGLRAVLWANRIV